ncbi:4682_t:CDS:1, partial [Scutellospora calospora]
SNLLENSKTVSSASDVSRTLPDSNVHLSSFALPCGVTGSKKENSTNGEDGITKKLSRPPNVFILYNRAKQSQTLDHHQDIPNNEIGKMWHENKRIDYDYFSCKSCKKKNWLEVGVKEKYIKSFEYSSFNNWSKIGEGGFGIVYSAYSNDVEKIVALKRLRNSDSENSFHEFIRE